MYCTWACPCAAVSRTAAAAPHARTHRHPHVRVRAGIAAYGGWPRHTHATHIRQTRCPIPFATHPFHDAQAPHEGGRQHGRRPRCTLAGLRRNTPSMARAAWGAPQPAQPLPPPGLWRSLRSCCAQTQRQLRSNHCQRRFPSILEARTPSRCCTPHLRARPERGTLRPTTPPRLYRPHLLSVRAQHTAVRAPLGTRGASAPGSSCDSTAKRPCPPQPGQRLRRRAAPAEAP